MSTTPSAPETASSHHGRLERKVAVITGAASGI